MTTQTLNRCGNHNCECTVTEDHLTVRGIRNASAMKTNKALVVVRPGFNGEGVDRIIDLACSDTGKTKVYLKYVVDMDPIDGLYLGENYFDKLREEVQTKLNPEMTKLEGVGLETEVLRPHFSIAAEEILRVEKTVQPDVIVIEAPRLSTFRRLFNRDFTDSVIREAKAPVLTVRHTDDLKERYPEPFLTDHHMRPVVA